jgi:hypothetical protein
MEIKKILAVGYMSILSVTCVMAQTAKSNYYQPGFARSYDAEEDDAVSLVADEDNDELNGFQRDARLTVRNGKQTKKSGKKLEKAYGKAAKKQKRLNQMQEHKIRKNERAYFRLTRKEGKKV